MFKVLAESRQVKGRVSQMHIGENDISYDIRGAAFKVHTELGPGLLESVYETAISYELKQKGYEIKNQVGVPMV